MIFTVSEGADVPKSKADVKFNGYSTRKNYTIKAEIVSEN